MSGRRSRAYGALLGGVEELSLLHAPLDREPAMLHSKTGRLAALAASACLLLALGVGLLGLAVQQGVITPRDVKVELGPLILIARGPRSLTCSQVPNAASNLCGRLGPAPGPQFYRMWVFWYTPGRGVQSARILAQWTLPLRDGPRNPNNRSR